MFVSLREHDFNNDSHLDGLEILAAIKHSELAHELSVETANLTDEALKKATEKELGVYTGIFPKVRDSHHDYSKFI